MQEDEENNHIMKAMSGQYDRLTNVEEAVDDFQDDPATPLENGADQIDLFEDEPTDDLVSASPSNASRPTSSRRIRSGDSWYHSCLLSDERFSICGIELLDGSPAVRLVKFVCVTISAICLMHQFLRVVVSAACCFVLGTCKHNKTEVSHILTTTTRPRLTIRLGLGTQGIVYPGTFLDL